STVDRDDDGGTTPTLTLSRKRGREILARTVDGGEQLDAIAGSKRVQLGRRVINRDVGGGVNDARYLLVAQADNIDVGGLDEVIGSTHIAGEIGCDHGTVHTGPTSQ